VRQLDQLPGFSTGKLDIDSIPVGRDDSVLPGAHRCGCDAIPERPGAIVLGGDLLACKVAMPNAQQH